jgi:Ca2+:H+ antiporter
MKTFLKDPLNYLMIAIPLAILASLLGWPATAIFVLSAIGLVPMARLIGSSTEVLASHTGPAVGGLLNATLGNAAELIITIVAIREGLLELVKASITGSILGNLLLVLGMSMLLGGLRNGVQTFDKKRASNNAILLVLAVLALLIPSMLSATVGPAGSVEVEALSLGTAFVMIVLYILGIIYTLKTRSGPLAAVTAPRPTDPIPDPAAIPPTMDVAPAAEPEAQPAEAHGNHARWSVRTAILVLVIATVFVAYLSELLVGAVEPVMLSLGISEFFLGIILIPLIGNVAEHLVAVKVALQNHMDLSVEIAVSSSLQIALFVAPILVFISLFMGNPLLLIFNTFELLALVAGVLIAALVSVDGESNWLEGAELLAIYLIIALASFLI